MPIIAKNTGSSGTSSQAPEGVHRAVCVGVIDLGTQPGYEFQGKMVAPHQKVMILWELVDEHTPEGVPYVVKGRYRNSLHENATLRAVLEQWRGRAFTETELKGFDLANLLGKPCQVNVVRNVKGYADVASVVPFGKGMQPIKEVHNDTMYFAVDDQDGPDWKFPENLPEWIQDEIKKSAEWQAFAIAGYGSKAEPAQAEDGHPFEDEDGKTIF